MIHPSPFVLDELRPPTSFAPSISLLFCLCPCSFAFCPVARSSYFSLDIVLHRIACPLSLSLHLCLSLPTTLYTASRRRLSRIAPLSTPSQTASQPRHSIVPRRTPHRTPHSSVGHVGSVVGTLNALRTLAEPSRPASHLARRHSNPYASHTTLSKLTSRLCSTPYWVLGVCFR